MNPKLPNARAPIFPGGSPPGDAYRKWMESIGSSDEVARLQIQITSLDGRVTELEVRNQQSIGLVLGTKSVRHLGDLHSGNVTLSLVNDEQSPGNSYYYGTSDAGVKGYHALPEPELVYNRITSEGDIRIAGDGSLRITD